MLRLSTIRQYYDSGFCSVVRLVEELEQQIEALTLANQSPNHFQYSGQTISNQQEEIKRLSQTVDNKSNIFEFGQKARQRLLIALESVLNGKPLTVNN